MYECFYAWAGQEGGECLYYVEGGEVDAREGSGWEVGEGGFDGEGLGVDV